MDGTRHPRQVLLLAFVTALLGVGSMLLFGLFLLLGPLGIFNLGLSERSILLLDGLLSIVFFFQHSGMVRRGFRRKLERIVQPVYGGAVYTIGSAAALLALAIFWQESSIAFGEAHGALRLLLRALFVLGVLGFLWGGWALHSFDPLGINAIRDHLRGTVAKRTEFVIRGPYHWVRHPFYLCSLLMIWSFPAFTADRLLFNFSWTAWIIIGAMLEERDLIASFGPDYRAYQRSVPMLLPLRIPSPPKRRSPSC